MRRASNQDENRFKKKETVVSKCTILDSAAHAAIGEFDNVRKDLVTGQNDRVLDAARAEFVLNPRNLLALRAQRLQDVIHQGGLARAEPPSEDGQRDGRLHALQIVEE
jgi:hypothetical protein